MKKFVQSILPDWLLPRDRRPPDHSGLRIQPRAKVKSTSKDTLPVEVHMLWVSGELSMLERLCCASFARNGYAVSLWTYGDVGNLPEGFVRRDAREIIPESGLFLNCQGSYAAFSDVFRYTVLSKNGGMWADTDVICLTPMVDLMDEDYAGFLVTEWDRGRSRGRLKVNGNLIFHPRPARGDLIELALAVSERFDRDRIAWGEIGPDLLTALARTYPQLAPPILNPDFSNPFAWWNCPECLLKPGAEVPGGAAFLHCYNETWRRAGVDKNLPYPDGSVMAKMASRYL